MINKFKERLNGNKTGRNLLNHFIVRYNLVMKMLTFVKMA